MAGDLPLLTDRVSRRLGFGRLAAALGRPGLTPYLLPLAAWTLDIIVLSSISYVVYGRSQFEAPFVAIIPFGLVLAVWLTKWVRTRYLAAVDDLPAEQAVRTSLHRLPSLRFRVGVLAVFAVGNVVNLWLSPVEVAAFVEIHGQLIAYTKYAVVAPLYFVVFADITSLLIAGMLVLPVQIYRENIDLDFSDPMGFAGLYETSRLLRAGTITYFVALTAWTIFLITPSIAGSTSDISSSDALLFPILWVCGLVLYGVPLLVLHRHIDREKKAEITRIHERITQYDRGGTEGASPDSGGTSRPEPAKSQEAPAESQEAPAETRDVPAANEADGEDSTGGRGLPYIDPHPDDIPEVQQQFMNLQQVRHARDYPVNMAILEELLLAAVIPLVLQFGLSMAFNLP